MKKYIWIGIAGAAGALLRYCIKNGFAQGDFPVGTLLINCVGCFLIVFFREGIQKRMELGPDVQAVVVAGFLGAFTTFSALCRETVLMLGQGRIAAAVFYILLCVGLGLAAAYAGNAASKVFKTTDGKERSYDTALSPEEEAE